MESQSANASLPEEKSFFAVSSANVLISTIKKAEDDEDVVLRFYEIEGQDTPAVFNSFVPFSSGEWTNIIEEEGRSMPVKGQSFDIKVGHYAIETLKLEPSLK